MKRLVYAALKIFSGIDRIARERLTAAGWVALGAAALAGVAGVDTHQTLAYQAFTFLAALLALALAASALLPARIAAERELPRYVTVRKRCTYSVTIANQGGRSLVGATVLETYPQARPTYADWRAVREPGEQRRNWFDRNAGYFRWRWLIERRLPERVDAEPLPALPAGASTTLKLTLTPRRRGRIELAGIAVSRVEPLGLVRKLTRVPQPASVIALPRRYRIPHIALPGRRKFQQGGVSLATSVGDSEEFVGLRDYRPGDALQKIHWKSFARTGKPIVKEYQDEFYERHALILDTSRAAGEDEAFEEAVAVAASFVYTIETLECLLDLMFVGGEAHCYTAGRGQMQIDRMLEILAGVAPSAPQAFDSLERAAHARAASLSSCIVVLVDWDQRRRRFVESLMGRGLDVRALLVCARETEPADAPAWLLRLHPGEIETGLAGLR